MHASCKYNCLSTIMEMGHCSQVWWLSNRLGNLRSESQQGKNIFLIFKTSRLTVKPTQPPTHKYLCSSSGVKQPGRAVNHSHLHLVLKVRINGFIPPLLLYAFVMWTGKTLPCFTFYPQSNSTHRISKYEWQWRTYHWKITQIPDYFTHF